MLPIAAVKIQPLTQW